MVFEVVLTLRAQTDIDDYVCFIANDSRNEAAKWRDSLEEQILSLSEIPGRFSLIPEATELRVPYRAFMHHSHRVIFRIDEEAMKVYVVRVYHGARKPLTRM